VPALPDPIPDPLVELLAGRLRVIGEPTRIRVLDCLRHGPTNMQSLVDAAGTSQQNVSKHRTRLMEHGFIGRERHGTEHHYRIIDTSPLQILDLLSADLADQLRRLAELIGHDAPDSEWCAPAAERVPSIVSEPPRDARSRGRQIPCRSVEGRTMRDERR